MSGIEWEAVDGEGALPMREGVTLEAGPSWLYFPDKDLYDSAKRVAPDLPEWEDLEDMYAGKVLRIND